MKLEKGKAQSNSHGLAREVPIQAAMGGWRSQEQPPQENEETKMTARCLRSLCGQEMCAARGALNV